MNPLYSTAESSNFDDTSFEVPMRKGEAIGGIPWHLPAKSRSTRSASAGESAHALEHDTSAHDSCGAVAQALSDTRWDFRTVKGIAAETGLDQDTVKHVLEEHRLGRKPWGRRSDDRYTRRDRPVSMRERLSLLTSYIAKRPT